MSGAGGVAEISDAFVSPSAVVVVVVGAVVVVVVEGDDAAAAASAAALAAALLCRRLDMCKGARVEMSTKVWREAKI